MTAAAFVPALFGGFVFDDHRFIVENRWVQAPAAWLRVLTDPTMADPLHPGVIVRPLRTAEFALDHAVFGNDAFGFHLHSLAWHVLAAVLLALLLRRLTGSPLAAAAGALLWSLHPAQVESVAFISSRGDVAMGACCLASILLALSSKGRDLPLFGSLAAAALACLAKETAVALPIVVAALRWTGLVRVRAWPWLAVAGAYLVWRFAVTGAPADLMGRYVLGGSTAGTFATMVRAFGFYLAETLLPAQSLDWYLQPSFSFAEAAVVVWLAVHVALVVSALIARRRAPLWTVGVVWFYAFLLPVANWPVFLGIPTTERFLYLPLAGAAIAAAGLLRSAPRLLAPAAVVALAFAAGTLHRIPMWHDDDVLWRTVLDDHEGMFARATRSESLRTQALDLRARAVPMPAGPDREAAATRVRALFESALDEAHRALRGWCRIEGTSHPVSGLAIRAETNAANLCFLLGRDEEALFHAEEAIRNGATPRPEPHYDRALALLRLGFPSQAAQSMESARELGFSEPDAEIAQFFLDASRRCAEAGLLTAAEQAARRAEELAPSDEVRDAAAAQQRNLTELRRTAGIDGAAALARSDAALARVPRRCPERPEIP